MTNPKDLSPILVVAAHPDDEVLGCGGTMARLNDEGHEVHVLILGEGVTSRGGPSQRRELLKLQGASKKANKLLGISSITFEKLPDNRLDRFEQLDLVKKIERVVSRIRPGTVFTHHAGDVNVDHKVVHDCVVTSTRPYPGQTVRRLLFFEAPSSTEWQVPGQALLFTPQVFISIETTLPRKLAALKEYDSEMRPWPHVRSVKAVEHLARWRGATAGCEAAEAFMLGRQLL